MKSIPAATPIILTETERTELEGLTRSTKTEYRMRQQARIVLMAADGMASRAIGREVGCTTGAGFKRAHQARDGSLGDFPQEAFEFGVGFFDRVATA
jgi:hypothetical protein